MDLSTVLLSFYLIVLVYGYPGYGRLSKQLHFLHSLSFDYMNYSKFLNRTTIMRSFARVHIYLAIDRDKDLEQTGICAPLSCEVIVRVEGDSEPMARKKFWRYDANKILTVKVMDSGNETGKYTARP